MVFVIEHVHTKQLHTIVGTDIYDAMRRAKAEPKFWKVKEVLQ